MYFDVWRTCTNAKIVQNFELAKRKCKNLPLTTYILVSVGIAYMLEEEKSNLYYKLSIYYIYYNIYNI